MKSVTTVVHISAVVLLLLHAPPAMRTAVGAQRLGIDLSDSASFGRTQLLRLHVSAGPGSRTLLLMDVPAGRKESKVFVSSRDKRVSVQPAANDGVWTALSRFELDGVVAPGQGTGIYVEALEVSQPERPADVVTLKT